MANRCLTLSLCSVYPVVSDVDRIVSSIRLDRVILPITAMKHDQSNHLNTDTSCRWGDLLLRLVLVLATWQGPIPWWHCHGTETALVSESEQGSHDSSGDSFRCWLLGHLLSHHSSQSGMMSRVEVHFGWHMHFLISRIPGTSASDKDTVSAQEGIPGSDSAELLSGIQPNASSALCLQGLDDAWTAQRGFPCSAVQAGPANFFDTFAPALAVPIRFCVSRC